MTADSSTDNHSPRSALTSSDGVNSQSRRRSLPSPWAQVVRGDPETISAVPHSPSSPSPSPSPEQTAFPDCLDLKGQLSSAEEAAETQMESSDSSNGNAGRPKKHAWNKPINGVVEVGPVMGAVSWPALSESTRPTPKSSSDSSSKPPSDGSVSISQGPVISHSPHKQANSNANPNSTLNHIHPVRQRSIKRFGGTGGGSTGFSRPPPPPPLPPPFPLFDMHFGNLVPAVMDPPVREPQYRGNNWVPRPMGGVGSHSHAVNDHSSHRNPSRRGNFGSRPYLNGYGSRRDQDRGWHAPRSSTARNIQIPHQMVPPPPPPSRLFIRPPHLGSSPFITPSFGNPMGFDMASPFLYVPTLPPEPFRGAPLVSHAPPPAMFFPVVDASLPTSIVNQIEYYFSDGNLVKDNFLRSNMDDQGWVPITLIASFPRVQSLTIDTQFILDSLRDSMTVEVQGDKVRRRNDWGKWISTSGGFPTYSGSQSPNEAMDSLLAPSFQELTVDELTANQNSTMATADAHVEIVTGSSSAEFIDQSEFTNGEVTAEARSSQ